VAIYDYHPRPAARKSPPGVHPKWLSCFPGGTYFGDDGTPDPEEPEHRLFMAVSPETFVEVTSKNYQDVLAELGF
jgi:hypothetical protein